ncbi:helix-turn-helix transcriptional regulator [Nostoc favosum]|uniref:AraC family transcriptional regulator n=1 Tax=Nostoc favosum CHAB5714 TaxID=2780399 RepID=A0ABS8IHB4_9NOSO|nr:AraC family transcriptional regulator [Nostoc favosum]MCC5603296.1 AraC family transcriptional regulator [Nostoc favosum CHAB5714]
MTITLTIKDYDELLKTSKENTTCYSALEPCEYIDEMPKRLGRGYYREMEVYPELSLIIFDKEYHHDLVLKIPVSNHPLQFGALALGMYTDTYGQVGGGHTFISGSGVQHKHDSSYRHSQRILGVDIIMPPELLRTFFPGKDGEMLPQLKFLAKESDWQTLLYPKTNAAIQSVVLQIINCPYQGTAKRMYLQGKVIELMALQLAPFLADNTQSQLPPRLKRETIAKIHHAKEILQARLENPPLLSELAQQLGVSESTLQRGFQMQFGTTVFGYLTNQRMEQAHQLLQNRNFTVAEVANIVGYAHLGHFAAAFKRKFGMTPRECFLGKKLVSGL